MDATRRITGSTVGRLWVLTVKGMLQAETLHRKGTRNRDLQAGELHSHLTFSAE